MSTATTPPNRIGINHDPVFTVIKSLWKTANSKTAPLNLRLFSVLILKQWWQEEQAIDWSNYS